MATLDVMMEELMRRATIAMHHKHYEDALYNIDHALEILPGIIPHWTRPFFHIRAECLWQMAKYEICLQNMRIMFDVGLSAMNPFETMEEYNKWMTRSEFLLDSGISLAPVFFDLCKAYSKTPKERARCFVMEGVATCSFFDQRKGLELIRQGEQVDRSVLEEASNKWKTKGIAEFKNRNYQISKQLLQRALIVTREDSAHSETRRSILSHLATVHFYLKEYQLAFKAGEKSYHVKSVPSKDEAERWKERGKMLFREKQFRLLIKYYSLAIKFTSNEEHFVELRCMLLSNRSIAYNKNDEYQKALEDAKECVRINPRWSKGQYRLGSSLLGLGRHQEALASFCRAFEVADPSESKDIALQILSVGENLEDGISRESLNMPKQLVQELIKRVTDVKDWKKLYLLFMGGSGSPRQRYGKGGLATGLGCDTSRVPLELIVYWGISNNVKFLASFIEELLKHGAQVLGTPGCDESPIQIASRLRNDELLEVLSKYDKTQGGYWKEEGLNAFRSKNYEQAIRFLTTATKCHLSTQEQIEIYGKLSETYHITKDYRKSVDNGHKLYNLRPLESKAISEKWKKRGNDLLGERNYDIMIDCYTLALNYAPEGDSDMRAAILSNRSMAFLNKNLIAKAKNDANLCILNRKTWFRGYSRLASCFSAENDHQEAINHLCKGLSAVQTDEEKFNLANDIVSMAKKKGTSIKIPQPIPNKIFTKLIKQAVGQKDYETLRYLFLEKTCHHRTGSTTHMRTLAHDVKMISFIPLEMILESDVKDKPMLVIELIAHGVSPNGSPNCTRTPLQLAVDERDYRMAALLLKHGADPLKILKPNEVFDPSEGSQGLQWMRLARKAKHANFKRAEMFYSLALEFPEVTKSSHEQLEAFKSLSEICFESKKYDECLRYGYECLRLVPTKSEVEAKKWLGRGETLTMRRIYSVVPDYLTLALNYAPPSNKPLRYELLCRRAFAYSEIDDFQQAVEDGDNATKIQPDDVEGYKCLVSCYKSLGRDNKTLYALAHCLRTEENLNEKRHYFEEAMEVAARLPEGTTALTSEVPTSFIEQVQDKAIQSHNWELLRVLYLGGGGPDQLQVGKGGLATKRIRATQVPIEDAVSASFKSKPETLAALLDHGANVNGLRGNSNPLVCAVAKGQVEVAKVLLEHRANPCVKTDNSQPLLHNVVQKAIETGSLDMLRCLLSFKHADIENVQDPKGCTLYHLAMNGKVNENKKKVIRLLMDANINPTLKNKSDKRPVDCCSSRDDRKKMLIKFMKRYVPTVKEETKEQLTDEANNSSQQTKLVNEKVEEEQEKVPIAAEPQPPIVSSENNDSMKGRPLETKPLKSKDKDAEEKKKVSLRTIEYLIERLKIVKPDDLRHQAIDDEIMEVTEDIIEETTEIPENGEGTKAVGEDEEAEDGGLETAKNEEEEIDVLDSESPFENLTWEVDCTESVWKTLQSKRVSEKMKKSMVKKIRMLAEGRWSKTTCKKMKGEPEKKGILLYESKLTKGARILWEKTIAFSPRCSNDPELRLQASVSKDGANNDGENRATSGDGTGRIYSEIIRVWSIVLDHGDLQHQIENVVKSHDRGSHCIVKADLKGFGKNQSGSSNYPAYYMERSKKEPSAESEETFFPPASSKENEFHILKFYSVTSAVINTLLAGDGKTKIDFPFKVTELEHAIINLQPKPPCPIILLGRSGTGKTTCCLYRLWTEFQNYWENASRAGPYIPKYIAAEAISEEVETSGNCAESSSGVEYLQAPVAENDDVCVCDDDSMNEPHIRDEEENKAANSPERCEHFHPLFITKNTVLCSEVQKNFKELRNACPVTKAMTNLPGDSLPNCIQDIGDTSWPLFIGARDWMLLLDASLPGTTFFKRAKDGSLLKRIEGWGEEDTHLHFIPEGEEDDDEIDDEVEEAEHVAEEGGTKRSKPQAKDVKREATYQVFRDELWPKINKSKKTSYHPTLVWTEIRSFIKGSVEALGTKHGFLSLQEYQDLGQKRAPNFIGDRSKVYDLFLNYRSICNRQGLFDEADLVYHLHKRLSENPELSWSIHSVYVDETQDFTQAELSLLIRCCRFQNRMFFTGDTAQSIMRGIAFRFEDLKTLFHGINAFKVTTPDEPVRIPDRLYQLTHNYRSHTGILRLASSVVNLLSHYFPESFDKLEEDCGLFDGPKPVLLESCSLSDLAMILRGNKRQASRIEFGAHQAVLVVSEEARDNMPGELKHGLVLTIYEAKGLEFDDVLIYNFFKDSHAKKEWRVVTSYIEEKQKEARGGTSGLVELQEKDLTLKTRPLEFQPEKHKVLNSEFKYLYTAITRARVNVWFFDEDEESRSPMFEYFRRLNLVRAITLEDEGEGTATSLSSMFAESSTKEEWREQGMFFYDKDLWGVAEKCFIFGEDEFMVRKCKAQQQAQEALKHRRSNPRLMKEKFILAATQFLECDMGEEAEMCLHNARERLLLAKLYKKLEKFAKASKFFRLERHYEEASECMEIMNNYSQAIEIVCEAQLYEKAIEVLERYNSLKKIDEMEGILPPKPNRTIERLCYKLAETHLKDGKREDMERVLQSLPSADDRISFLMKHECIEEAARALVDNYRREEAAQFLQLHGRFKAAKRYANDPKFLGDCSFYEARVLHQKKNTERNDEIVQLLEDAVEYYRRCKDRNGEAEASLFLGRLKDDLELITECGKMFEQCHNICGESEVVGEWLKRGHPSPFYYRITVRAIERLLNLIFDLQKPNNTKLNAKQHGQIALCEQFFGLLRVEDTRKRSCRTSFCERFHLIAPRELLNESKNMQVEVSVKDAYQTIGHDLIAKAIDLIQKTKEFFMSKLELKAGDESYLLADMPFNEKFEVLFNWIYLDSVTVKFYNHLKQLGNSPILSKAENVIPKQKERFLSCKLFTRFLFPEAGCKVQHPTADQIAKIRKHHAVKPRLLQFCNDQWKSLETERGAPITDVFLQVSQVMQLLDVPHDQGINVYLNEKEESFLHASKEDPSNKKLIHENGILTLKGTGKVSFEIFLRHWEIGKKKLHSDCDVLQSLHETSRRFLTYTAKSHFRFFPSIANTLMILEHQLTVALILFARIKCQSRNFCCCIPESYLKKLEFTDNLNFTRRRVVTTFGAVERHARSCSSLQEEQKCLRAIQSLLSHIVKLMFGIISFDFNVFTDTFSFNEFSDKLIASGVADRTLILSLTMLVNCGKVLYADCEEVILHYIFTVIPHSSLPEHLKIAFQSMGEVSKISDAVKVLKNLLHARNAEKLFDVGWNYASSGLDTRTSKPENYNLHFDVNVSEVKDKAKAEFSSSDVTALAMEEREEDQEDERTVEEESISRFLEIEKERKDSEALLQAVIKMQRLCRRSRRKKTLQKDEQLVEGKDHLDPTEDHLSAFKTDSTACKICGVYFQVTSVKNVEGSEVSSTYASHVASPVHNDRQKLFGEYKELYVSRVEKILRRVRSLDERNVSNRSDIDFDMQQLDGIKKKLWEKKKQIETRLEWEDTSLLIPLLENLEKKVRETETLVQASSTTDLDEKDEKEIPGGHMEEDEEEDLEEILTVRKQKKNQGHGSRGKRNRKKAS